MADAANAVSAKQLGSAFGTVARLIRTGLGMCGIAGVLYADRHRPAELNTLHQMGDAIAHRGPDGEGFLTSGPVGLVHRRLAIIDLAGGDQPVSNEDDSIHVVFNGEIYNYPELRQKLETRGHQFRTNSDTEVLVHLYEDHGRDLVTQLRGMFAFAIWDERQQQLLLARDHLGQKPLFVYRDDEKLLFGSELKAILAHANVNREISPEAIEDYLTYGVIPGERCVFRHVRRLPPAHTLQIAPGTLQNAPRRYWQLNYAPDHSRDTAQWLEQFDEAIHESVAAHLIADVPVGAFLSGGLDSSAIVAACSRVDSEQLQTFSIGFQEREFSELPHAQAVAQHYNTKHREEVVTPDAVQDLDDLVFYYDEPFADASAIPTMAAARMAAKHVKVCLSGDGGDELFGGYARYSHDLKEAALRNLLPGFVRSMLLKPLAGIWPKADWLPRPMRLRTLLQNISFNPAEAYANTVATCRQDLRSRLMSGDLCRQLAGRDPATFVEDLYAGAYSTTDEHSKDPLRGMLAADTQFLLPDDFLVKTDRASMAFGLEVRPPLIDWKLMELAATLPSEFKIRNGSKKWILKELFGSRLPDRLVHRKKQGFELPVHRWLKGPLKEQVEAAVLSSSSPIGEFIDQSVARKLFDAHCRGTGRHGFLIWSLLVLGRWLDRWSTPESTSPLNRAAATSATGITL